VDVSASHRFNLSQTLYYQTALQPNYPLIAPAAPPTGPRGPFLPTRSPLFNSIANWQLPAY